MKQLANQVSKSGEDRVLKFLLVFSLFIASSTINSLDARAGRYRDRRPQANLRMEARDYGVVLRHGDGPNECDIYGARDAWVFEADGKYYMHYDASGPYGWLCVLATSTNLVDWQKKGPVLELGKSGEDDSKSASYGTTYFDGREWHMFYVGTPNTSRPPNRVPHAPYMTMKAKSKSPTGPWIKQKDVIPFRPEPGTYYSCNASPGQVIKYNGEYLQFFSGQVHLVKDGIRCTKRTIGIARTRNLNGRWTVDPSPIVPLEEQIENSSLYYEESNKTWVLFTNHIGINGNEYTDAIWVYWTKNLNKWDTNNKAIVLDGQNCKWSKNIIGLPSVLKVGNRLALFYDGQKGNSLGHMNRDIGLAWLDLPLVPPKSFTAKESHRQHSVNPLGIDVTKLQPVPDRLVVLTFDDGPKSNAAFVAPLLKRYGFGATFYITEFYDFRDNCPKEHYMTWEEIRRLHDDGFEIGNHTRTHRGVRQPEAVFREDVEYIERRCEEYGIPKPKTFCYTSYRSNRMALKVLKEKGYLFARRGFTPEFVYNAQGSRGPIYDPKQDHPLLIPTTGASGPAWTFEDFLWAVKQAKDGKITVLTFHGVPDLDHPWVNTEPDFFKTCMDYLNENNYTVIAMRDLAKYIDPNKGPSDPYAPIEQRLLVTPTQLRCEYAVNPLGLDVEEPRFSWVLESYQRGQTQSAYQILVSSSEEKIKADIGDVWDSGKILSDKSVNVTYKGKPLISAEKCYWKVMCWDKDGKPSQWSETSTFEMGLLRGSDWEGQWIGADKSVSSALLRKEFEMPKDINRARVYISGVGWSELYINGEKVGDHILDPAMTDYQVRILYETYDVTDILEIGSNAIGVMLGNGWYSEPNNLRYGDSPRLLMQMNIEFADSNTMSVKSDGTWKTSDGPIIHNSIRYGEKYDARLEKPGWTKASYDDSGWNCALTKKNPGGKMESQLMPAIKVIQTIKPVKLTNPKEGVYVYDMGQLFGGWIRLHVKGPSGTKVAIKYSSRIYKNNGLINKGNYRAPKETDYYILKGDSKGETYEPRFTFHPVRYVQIEGYPGVPTIDDIQGRVVHSAIDLSGDFQCSNELINQIYQITFWTVKNVLYGMPLDCLGREWWAYLEPAETPANLYNRKYMPLFWTKFLNDVRYSQLDDGDIPVVVPNYTNYTKSDTAWSGNYPIAVWYVYQYYDDERILQEHYASMKNWLDYLTGLAQDNLVNKGFLGDHMLPGPKPGEEEYISSETPPALCWSGTYYRNASIVAQAAGILGKADDANHYSKLADNIKNAINEKWLNKDTNNYATGSQTCNLFPLALGIVPKENEKALVKNIVRDITEKYNGHLHTGIIGTTSLMEALTEQSYGDVKYGIATKTTYPSWGYMIAKGATTIWESWGRRMKKARSRADSMAMFATINEFFYGDLAGIKGPDYYGPGFMTPGFRQIHIKPYILGDLKSARASIKTIRGMVSSSWKRKNNSLDFDVTIPINSCAKVSVPKLGLKEIVITESGKLIWKEGKLSKTTPGITAGKDGDDYVTFDVGSGSYFFRLVGQ